MGRKKPEDQPTGDQMDLFEFQAPSAPELITDPVAEARRVKEVLLNQHGAHQDGGDRRLTNVNGAITFEQQRGGSTFVSPSGDQEGEVYRTDRSPSPPDLTSRQAALIGLIPSQPKVEKTPSSPTTIYNYPDLVGHFQKEELTPETLANLGKMAEMALKALRR